MSREIAKLHDKITSLCKKILEMEKEFNEKCLENDTLKRRLSMKNEEVEYIKKEIEELRESIDSLHRKYFQ